MVSPALTNLGFLQLVKEVRVILFSKVAQTVAYPRGGMGGPDPPTFQKVGHQDSHENVIKLVGGGGRADLSRSGL